MSTPIYSSLECTDVRFASLRLNPCRYALDGHRSHCSIERTAKEPFSPINGEDRAPVAKNRKSRSSGNGSIHKPCQLQLSPTPNTIRPTLSFFLPKFKNRSMLVSNQGSPSAVDRLPFHRLSSNHGVRLSSSSSSSSSASSASSTLEDRREEQHRRKLVGLHHAAFCTQVGQSPCCPPHCLAHKRIFTHFFACLEGAKCIIPGCAKARLLWTHFSTCTNAGCSICSVIPQEDRTLVAPPAKAHLPRSPKASVASTPTRRPGRPPLSPKPRFSELPPRSPPGSPTFHHRP